MKKVIGIVLMVWPVLAALSVPVYYGGWAVVLGIVGAVVLIGSLYLGAHLCSCGEEDK